MAVTGPPQSVSAMRDETVMDTRTPSPVHRVDSSSDSSPEYKPDLGAEVAMLSTKLVNAINYQTNLDDLLQQSRHELEQQRQKCAELEAENRQHDELVAGGILVKKSEVDSTITKLRSELANEKAAREAAEKGKKQTEGELENLTGALFEEANNMVANARKETEAVERRNAQLKSQLQDQDMLMASQQEQLQDLKLNIERLQNQTPPLNPSIPTTPVTTHTAIFDALELSPDPTSMVDVPPEHPLHFSQLIAPVLRNDISAVADFQELLLLARRLGSHSRQSSSNANSSTSQTFSASTSSPNLPGSFSFAGNSSPTGVSMANLPALKDSKFYKRVLSEDIEPTLRLDLAPGLSFLSRRTVLGSLLQGTLAVEPYPQNKGYYSCTLCGESRRGEAHARRYRFRTSEDDSVLKPLCEYCVSRLRVSCDFVAFLRMVRDGHWKCDSEDDQKAAWEESVRLRERMFWARVGGGVVPCLQLTPRNVPPTPSSAVGVKSKRASLGSVPEDRIQEAQGPSNSEGESTAEDTDVFQGDKDRPRSTIAEAITNASDRVFTAIPDIGRTREPVTPPTTGYKIEESDEGVSGTEPTTPFEDAHQQLEPSAELEPDNRTTTHSDDVDGSKLVDPQPGSVAGDPVPTSKDSLDDLPTQRRQALSSDSSRDESDPRKSTSSDRTSQQDRKPSSVLARVRAMETSTKQSR